MKTVNRSMNSVVMGGAWRWDCGALFKFGTQSDLGLEFETKVTKACLLQDSARHLGLDEGCCCYGQTAYACLKLYYAGTGVSVKFSENKN